MKRKTLFYLILFSFMLIFAEFAFRSFYAVSYKNASILLKPFHVIDRYYNGFTEEIDFEKDDHADYDILMLGGSVLTDQWGSIAPELDSYLEEQGLNVRIHNLAMPAHTSLDSRLKYENVAKNGYDLVLLYHGINETRFNNCPPEMFKDDYTHVDFYAKVYNLMHNSFSRYSITPLMIQQFQTNLFAKYSEENFMNFHNLDDKGADDYWSSFGSDIKTKKPFHDNYQKIIALAQEHETEVVIPTFAYHIPANYSQEAFENKALDYQEHLNPVELWGKPENVIKGIETHNAVVRSLDQESSVTVVGMHEKMPNVGSNFNDVCHFTEEGSKLYVEIIGPSVIEALARKN